MSTLSSAVLVKSSGGSEGVKIGTKTAVHRDVPVIESALLAYSFVLAAYFLLNFLFRWSRYLIFSGHGAYGWPQPTRLQLLGIISGSFAGAFIICCALAALAWAISRRRSLMLLSIAAIVLLCFAELDATWYSLAQEHVRLVDIELFFGLNVKAHLGVDARDLPRLTFACMRHVVILTAAAMMLARLTVRRPRWFQRSTLVLLAATAVVIVLAGNLAAYTLSNDQAWQQISHSNRLNATVTTLTHKTKPSARALQSMYSATQVAASSAASSAASPYAAAAQGASVIVIALEGWNPNFVNDTIMPFVSQLRAKSQVFENHYSSGNNTLLGTLGLLYGQTPLLFFDHEAVGQRSMFVDELRASGYRTKYFGEGLSSYRFIDSYLANFTDGGAPIPVGDSAIHMIDDFVHSAPHTFTYYYYGNTHFPYRHSRDFRRFQPEVGDDYQFDPDDIRRSHVQIANRYRNTLAEADSFIGRLLATLPWQQMIVVITGDHGESMLENGRLSHSSSLERPQIGTPMAIYVPGVPAQIHSEVTSHLDVFPTIFDVLGLPVPLGAQGVSMLKSGGRAALVMHNNQNDRPVEAAVVSDNVKLMVNLENPRDPRFTDISDGNDHPTQLGAHVPAIRDAFARLRQILGRDGCALVDSLSADKGGQPQNTTSNTIREDLRFCRAN